MKKLLMILLAMALCIPFASAENGTYYVDGGNADRVHLRQEPSVNAKSLGLYYTGTEVAVTDMGNGWARVLVGAVNGFIKTDFLTREPVSPRGLWYQVDNPRSGWANLRRSPSMEGTVISGPENGTVVRILGETADGWSYVDCGGVMGYMRTDLLREADDQAPMDTTVLARTAESHYIHQYTAPNGQHIYFTAWEEDVYLAFLDVNFDGNEDIVVDTVQGASNFYSEFFVYDGASGKYVRAEISGSEDRLCNYGLHPEYGVVSSYNNAGNAGLLHVWNLYRWDGTDLKLIRSAVSDEWSESSFEGDTHTQIIRGDILHMTVRNHTLGSYDDCIVWELIIPKEAAETRDIFTEEMEALWQGIK